MSEPRPVTDKEREIARDVIRLRQVGSSEVHYAKRFLEVDADFRAAQEEVEAAKNRIRASAAELEAIRKHATKMLASWEQAATRNAVALRVNEADTKGIVGVFEKLWHLDEARAEKAEAEANRLERERDAAHRERDGWRDQAHEAVVLRNRTEADLRASEARAKERDEQWQREVNRLNHIYFEMKDRAEASEAGISDLMAEVAIKDGAIATWKRDHDVQLGLYRKLEASNAALRGALEYALREYIEPDERQGGGATDVGEQARVALSTDAGRAYLDVVEAAGELMKWQAPKGSTRDLMDSYEQAINAVRDALARVQEASIGKGDNES